MRRAAIVGLLYFCSCSNSGGIYFGSGDGGYSSGDMSGGGGGGGDMSGGGGHSVSFSIGQNLRNKLDLLFMVDNSNSMEAMDAELRMRFPTFLSVLTSLAQAGTLADLHIGVVTSDYGAGLLGAPGCQPSPGGQQGKLQAIGTNAAAGCQAPVGANFIQYQFGANGTDGPNNLPAGQDLTKTFQCMASVGSTGCGFEHQLESVYAALHNNLPENVGFVRSDAILAVIFVTNEDDSSASPDVTFFEQTMSQFGFEDSYRQTRFGIQCGNPPMMPPYGDSGGDISPCIPAPNPGGGSTLEYDVSRYIDLFTKPAAQGGIKANPSDVVLVAIDAPQSPVQIILSNPGTQGGTPYQQCAPLDEMSSPPCVPVLQHSCMNPNNPVFFGDPAVRLNTVVNAVTNHNIFSICDADFTPALQSLGSLVSSSIGTGCIPAKLPNPSAPQCTATDVTTDVNGNMTSTPIPPCGAGTYPCWVAEMKSTCSSISPDGLGITIERNGQSAPPNTVTNVTCQL
jgi:hypothetical protein